MLTYIEVWETSDIVQVDANNILQLILGLYIRLPYVFEYQSISVRCMFGHILYFFHKHIIL